MVVHGIENLTMKQLLDEVRFGGRFVVFQWCAGLVAGVYLRPSAICFVPVGRSKRLLAFWHTLATLVLGWWAIPHGPRRAMECIRTNLSGGRDVTANVLAWLARQREPAAGAPPAAVPSRAA